MKTFTKIILAVSMLVMSNMASAVAPGQTVNIGTLDQSIVSTTVVHPMPAGGSFMDILNFSVSSESMLLSNLVELELAPVVGLDVFSWDIFAVGSNVALGYAQDVTSRLYGLIGPGDYFAQVSGSTTGIFGGSYTLNLVTAPVPEPSMIALMLGGLGLVGFMARRRKAA